MYELGREANATLGAVATVLLLATNLGFTAYITLYVKPAEAAKLNVIPSDGGALGREKKKYLRGSESAATQKERWYHHILREIFRALRHGLHRAVWDVVEPRLRFGFKRPRN